MGLGVERWRRAKAREGCEMNSDVFEGQWRQLRGELRSWWSKLTEDDLEKIGGHKDKLLGLMQEKYGYTREKAQQEIDRRLGEYHAKVSIKGAGGVGSAVKSPAREATSHRAETGGDESTQGFGSTAANKASGAAAAVAEKMGSLAGAIRQKVPQEGAVATAATAVADKLEVAGSYLQEKRFDNIAEDLCSLIRRYPMPSLLVGLGLGYWLGRSRGR